ncbi:MAG TPA: divergent polysaccharide deacetylase family protein [Candidatus Dormibacteraeota bacterium]|nr:divergent polysaccharide deacetylase family protein [Candidatus Dormibacteraeota bacterium]
MRPSGLVKRPAIATSPRAIRIRSSDFSLFLAAVLFSFLFTLTVSIGGCKKHEQRHLGAAEIYAITDQLAAAAKSAAPPGSEIGRNLRASDKTPESVDLVDVRIYGGRHETSYREDIARVEQALGGVATSHHLTQDGQSESREGIVFSYRFAGVPTHTIHLHAAPAMASRETPRTHSGGQARLAIILDDLGNDRAAAESIFALPYALTISVLPEQLHSKEIAEEAQRRGYQVMLHLPMQPVGKERAEAQELHPGMPKGEMSVLVDRFLREVPGVAGVNNHQGSQSTSDSALMAELMPLLRERRLFYIDSRTTAATVAYDTAQRLGVRSGYRNVPFLDDVAKVGEVRKQLQLAVLDAQKNGDAIAIGHPHEATLRALREVLPQVKAQGVRLVFASEVVH